MAHIKSTEELKYKKVNKSCRLQKIQSSKYNIHSVYTNVKNTK